MPRSFFGLDVILALVAGLMLPLQCGAVKAFPTAMGFGQMATGGRGGEVVFVTTLDCRGAGSLAAAIMRPGARTVVFRVGGTIVCTGADYLTVNKENGDLTIAGETAPGDGILVQGAELRIHASNVIIRHLRFRQDRSTSTGSNSDCLRFVSFGTDPPVQDIMVDHVSLSWALDENFDLGHVQDITVQNSIIAENTYGFLAYGTEKLSVLRNVFAKNRERNIRIHSSPPNNPDLHFEVIEAKHIHTHTPRRCTTTSCTE
jgi:pectate lyase